MMRRIVVLALLGISVACSAPQEVERPTVRGLLRNGQYDEAVAEAERFVRENPGEVRHVAVLAVTQAARAAPDGSPDEAVATLREAISASTRGRVLDEFATEAAGSRAFMHDRFMIAARICLTIADGWSPESGDTDATRGAGALLGLGAHGAEFGGTTEALARLLETGANLINASTNRFTFEDGDLHAAWVCFRGAGNLADAASRERRQDLSWAAAELAVQIAESNGDLAIPVMCDLSSPRDGLRNVLRYDRGMLSRFEDAIADASGCTPGTYAP